MQFRLTQKGKDFVESHMALEQALCAAWTALGRLREIDGARTLITENDEQLWRMLRSHPSIQKFEAEMIERDGE